MTNAKEILFLPLFLPLRGLHIAATMFCIKIARLVLDRRTLQSGFNCKCERVLKASRTLDYFTNLYMRLRYPEE